MGNENVIEGAQEPVVNEFDDAFVEAAGGEAEHVPAVAKSDDEGADKIAENDPPPKKLEEKKAAVAEDDEKFEQRYKTLQGIHRHDKEVWEQEKADLVSKVEAAAKKTPTEDPKKQAESDSHEDDLTDEQKAALNEYEEEFDLVSKMEGAKRDRALKALEKKMLDRVAALLDEKVAPIAEHVETAKKREVETAEEQHYSAIREKHADYETYLNDGSLSKWIESKSGYVRQGLQYAYERGSAGEIIEMFNDFKRENNITQEQPKGDAKGSQRKEEKRKALSAVGTRKAAVNPSMSQADDYDSAFEEAVAR